MQQGIQAAGWRDETASTCFNQRENPLLRIEPEMPLAAYRLWRSGSVRICSGKFISPCGGVKPPLLRNQETNADCIPGQWVVKY